MVKDINVNNYKVDFNKKHLQLLLTNRVKFLELLMLCIYLTSGSPIRGEEIVLLKYKNTLLTKLRNISISDFISKLIRIETSYSKTFNITRLDTNNISIFKLQIE